MKLFQNWNDPSPPAEIAGWIAGFRDDNPQFEHELWNEQGARRFIADRYGPREAAAFDAVRVPAMQADYLRLCLLDTFGGLYCDVDHISKQPLATLVEEQPGDLMLQWLGVINTAQMLFRAPGNPFIRICLALCTDNVEKRRFTTGFTATGPGVQNAVAAILDPAHLDVIAPSFTNDLTIGWGFTELVDIARDVIGEPAAELRQAYDGITIRPTFYISRWMDSPKPAYKESGEHWLNWTGPIYK